MLLDQVAAVFRLVETAPLAQSATQVYAAIRCAIVPVSSFDEAGSYAYTATHIAWVPFWVTLQREDELRIGRRLADNAGDLGPRVYVVNGLRRTTQGIPQTAYYMRQKD